MDNLLANLEQLLFGVVPYLAVVIFFLMTIQRYKMESFSYSSVSSQFLENQFHFWGMVPFHYGILIILTGHLVAFLIPEQILAWNNAPIRLYILEISGLLFAIFTLTGLFNLIVRRRKYSKVGRVTSTTDWILLAMLVFQIAGGIYVAIAYRWGTSWYAVSMVPYLWSLIKLNPDVAYIIAMPLMVKLHVVNAILMLGFFPFTRLVHILVVPNPYLWRRNQIVRWYRDSRAS